MLKSSPSVLANDPVPDDAAEEDVLEAVDVEALLMVVLVVEAALLVVLVVVAVVVFTVELDVTDVTIVVSEFAKWKFPSFPGPAKAPGPARNSRGCKETTDVAFDDEVAEVVVAEAVPGTH